MSHDNPSFESKIPSLSASKSHLSTTPSPSKSFPKTKTSNEQVSVFPARSIATKVLVVVPIGKLLPDPNPAIWETVAVPQLSEAVGTI